METNIIELIFDISLLNLDMYPRMLLTKKHENSNSKHSEIFILTIVVVKLVHFVMCVGERTKYIKVFYGRSVCFIVCLSAGTFGIK